MQPPALSGLDIAALQGQNKFITLENTVADTLRNHRHMPHEFHIRLFKLKAAGQERRCACCLTQIHGQIFECSVVHVAPKPAPALGIQHLRP